jgi:hypothetical protein
MIDSWAHQLEAWHDWYLLVGTAAATLTGLMFVVVTLGPQIVARDAESNVRAFVTPTVTLFTTPLLVSVLMLVPGLTPVMLGAALAIVGLCGLVYLIAVGVYTRWRINALDAVDRVWYVALPFVGYGIIVAASVAILLHAPPGLPIAAGGTLLLLVIGIHNAWDLVLYFAQKSREDELEAR